MLDDIAKQRRLGVSWYENSMGMKSIVHERLPESVGVIAVLKQPIWLQKSYQQRII